MIIIMVNCDLIDDTIGYRPGKSLQWNFHSATFHDLFFLHCCFSYLENLTHSFSADKYDYYNTESTNISCNGSVDFRLFRAVSISKGNVTLIESESGIVKFSTSSLKLPQQQYGLYTCTIYASEGVKFIKEIHLSDQGM